MAKVGSWMVLVCVAILFYVWGVPSPGLPETSNGPPQTKLSAAERFLPSSCHEHMVHEFPVLTKLLEEKNANGTTQLGHDGGHWSACTHIKIYGTNFAPFFARHLAYALAPSSVLEFGCGLGTTSDFLARHSPNNARVVCVEPEATMVSELFGSRGHYQHFPDLPLQLKMLSLGNEATKPCSDDLFAPTMNFDLVVSFEVAEHIDPQYTPELIQRLASATTKYLVFSAARPDQGGTGHIPESMHNRTWWIDQLTSIERPNGGGKLRLLPQLSLALRHVTSYTERAYDFGTNLFALGAPGVEDIPEIPRVAHDGCLFYPAAVPSHVKGDRETVEYAEKHNLTNVLAVERPCPAEALASDLRQRREAWVAGQTQALWPELDHLIRRVKSGDLKC